MDTSSSTLAIPITELAKLVQGRKEFGSIDALCIDLCGGVETAGHMLKRLLYWWQKTARADGWVYKSHVDWYNELRISQKQLPKANAALALAGVETALIKGRLPSAVKHYRLNADKFAAALAKATGLDTEVVKDFCAHFVKSSVAKKATGDTQKGKLELPQTATPSSSLTTDSSSLYKHTETSSVPRARDVDGDDLAADSGEEIFTPERSAAPRFEEKGHEASAPKTPLPVPQGFPQIGVATNLPYEAKALYDKGLSLEVWAAYVAKYGELACLKAADNALRRGTYPPGLFRDTLDKGQYQLQPATVIEASGKTDEIYDKSDDDVDATEVDPLPYIDPVRVQQWQSAFAQLELQLDKPNFDTWLRDAQIIGFEDETFVIGVRNQYARQRLTYWLNKKIDRVLEDVVGAPVAIRYEVYVPRKRHEDKEMPLNQLAQS